MKLHNPRRARVTMHLTVWGWLAIVRILFAAFMVCMMIASTLGCVHQRKWWWAGLGFFALVVWIVNLRRYIDESWAEFDERSAEVRAMREALKKRDDDREA